MPQYLRNDTIRLLESSVEALRLGLLSLGVPLSSNPRSASSRYSATIGLIGSAAELAMSACLVQVGGANKLVKPGESLKTASHVCRDFRALLKNASPASRFITQGVDDEALHRTKLLACTEGFARLAVMRAGGLHAGFGPERSVCAVSAQSVSRFLSTLSESTRIHSYVPVVPQLPEPISQVHSLVEELTARVESSADIHEKGRCLANLFLILPDVPEDPPEWLEALERVAVAPQKRDIIYLLRSCSQSVPGHLQRVRDAEGAIPVVVRPGDPAALPIAPGNLRTAFTNLDDQVRADIANANGRLSQGLWAPPPSETVKALYVHSLANTSLLDANGKLTAHQSWPFIASSLAVPGTPGPYWFLVRATSDLDQLRALLRQAAEVGPAFLGGNLPEVLAGIDAIGNDTLVSKACESLYKLLLSAEAAENKREQLEQVLQRQKGSEREASLELEEDILSVSRGEASVGSGLARLFESDLVQSAAVVRFWARVLCDAATTGDDFNGVWQVLQNDTITTAHTAARKALRLIDFQEYGPPLDSGVMRRGSRRGGAGHESPPIQG